MLAMKTIHASFAKCSADLKYKYKPTPVPLETGYSLLNTTGKHVQVGRFHFMLERCFWTVSMTSIRHVR
jgi:hypothetical protein